MKTYIINLVGSPGSGKSLISALLYVELKKKRYTVEYVQELAKSLVWQKQFDILDDQRRVSMEQYKIFKSMQDKVQFIITDGPLVHGIYYNTLPANVSNVEKTHNMILGNISEFNNINIFIERGDFPYEQEGRIQTLKESEVINDRLKTILDENSMTYHTFVSDTEKIQELVEYILAKASD
jgi:tRNA uridine 5-carbamoylmethylation protein Kti12